MAFLKFEEAFWRLAGELEFTTVGVGVPVTDFMGLVWGVRLVTIFRMSAYVSTSSSPSE